MKFIGILFLTSMLLRCELPKKIHAYREIQGRQLSLLTALSSSKHRNCFLQGDVHLRSDPCSSFCLFKSQSSARNRPSWFGQDYFGSGQGYSDFQNRQLVFPSVRPPPLASSAPVPSAQPLVRALSLSRWVLFRSSFKFSISPTIIPLGTRHIAKRQWESNL